MDLNGTEVTSSSPTCTRSVFSCPTHQTLWDLNGTTFSWVLIGITAITSPATIILNVLVIIAITRNKELQKHSNTLSSSLAVADILVSILNMALPAVIYMLSVYIYYSKYGSSIC